MKKIIAGILVLCVVISILFSNSVNTTFIHAENSESYSEYIYVNKFMFRKE